MYEVKGYLTIGDLSKWSVQLRTAMEAHRAHESGEVYDILKEVAFEIESRIPDETLLA